MEICINCLIQEFEIEALSYKNYFDSCDIMEIYSFQENAYKQNEIIFKHMCRYFISLIPQIKYNNNALKKIEGNWEISKLFYIAQETQRLLQERELEFINKKRIFQLEIIDNEMAFTIINEETYKLYCSLKKNMSILEMPFNYKRFIEIRNKVCEIFGDTVNSFFDLVLHSANGECFQLVDVTSFVVNNKDNDFIKGLLFKKENSSLKDALYEPYDSWFRPRFRPIIEFNLPEEQKYITTGRFLHEAFEEIYNNMIPFGNLPKEWLYNEEMKDFTASVQSSHGRLFEDFVAKNIEGKYHYLRNKKSINNISLVKCKNGIRPPGEIDFIILVPERETSFVADAKQSKTKYYFSAYNTDREHYINQYNQKLSDKIEWVSNHIGDVGKELKENLSEWKVKGFFITETFTLYSLVSVYPIIPYRNLVNYLTTENRLCFY